MTPGMDRARLLRRAGIPVAAAAMLGGAAHAASPQGALRGHPRWRFTFINHATTNPFFVPTRYGIADAAAFFGVASEWAGSERSDVGEMAGAMRRAID